MDAPKGQKDQLIECGEQAKEHFLFGKGYRNLNHGSFGTFPRSVLDVLRHWQDQNEERPDAFMRYDYPALLDRSREAIAKYLEVPTSTCVFLPNATTGVNTVLRNLVYERGDVIIFFATIYGSCEKTVNYITETTPAESYKIEYTYPVTDSFLCAALETAITTIKQGRKTAKLAIFDTIVSLPGVRMPFERLTEICKKHKVLSVIDGAHGVGHIPLNLSALDPDFFFSNCHKWLYVPRPCAVFYVPERNQHLMRSTLPTSHGFVPQPVDGVAQINNPLPESGKSEFVANFEFVGTLDNAPYLCVPAALEWRKRVTYKNLRGEDAVFAYNRELAHAAGETVASILRTDVMKNVEGTLDACNFSNVRLPLPFAETANRDHRKAKKIGEWIAQVLVDDYDTFMAIIFHGESWWIRLSSQVYLTLEDFVWAGETLRKVCDRVMAGEWTAAKSRL